MFKVNSELLNKESFQKAFINLKGIVLAHEEADRFIDYVYDQSVLKNNARQVKMDKASKNIRAIGLGAGKFLHPASTFVSSDYKQQLSHNLIVLTAKDVRGCAVIHDDDIEDNVEGDAFMDHIMKMVTKQIANELDEAYWIGHIGGFDSTDIKNIFDGWRYRITHSTVKPYLNDVSGSATILDAAPGATAKIDAASKADPCEITTTGVHSFKTGDQIKITNAEGMTELNNKLYKITVSDTTHFTLDGIDSTSYETYTGSAGVCTIQEFLLTGKIVEQNSTPPYNWEFKFAKARRRMPAKYKLDGLANLRFFTNDQVEEDYIEALAERSTSLGDTAMLGQAAIQWGKIPIVSCPLMSNTLDTDGKPDKGNFTDCMLTHKDNLIIGVHRDIEMETERSAADKATYFFYSLRADLAIENINAIVLIKNLKIG